MLNDSLSMPSSQEQIDNEKPKFKRNPPTNSNYFYPIAKKVKIDDNGLSSSELSQLQKFIVDSSSEESDLDNDKEKDEDFIPKKSYFKKTSLNNKKQLNNSKKTFGKKSSKPND